jgi:tetratricopeptide (TPR) repeat protein
MIRELLALLLLVAPAAAQDPMAAVAAAHADGRFEAARALALEALDAPDAPRLALLHALGVCEHELGRHDHAALAWRRALLHAPADADLLADLALAEQQLGLDRQAMRGFDPAPDRTWLLLCAVGCEALGLGLLVLRRHRALGGLLTVSGTAVALVLLPRAEAHAVVLDAIVEVRSEPHRDVSPVAALTPGEAVRVEEGSARWLRITHSRGTGWVPADGVARVSR